MRSNQSSSEPKQFELYAKAFGRIGLVLSTQVDMSSLGHAQTKFM